MAWFFRAIEQDDHSWVCRHGRTDYDAHPFLEDAIEHLLAISGPEGTARLFIHWRDGTVEERATSCAEFEFEFEPGTRVSTS